MLYIFQSCSAYLAELAADLRQSFWVYKSQPKSVFALKVKSDFTAKTPALNLDWRKVVIYEAVNYHRVEIRAGGRGPLRRAGRLGDKASC